MRLQQLTFFGFAALTFACAGGQTGDLSGGKDDNGSETGGDSCEQHKQKLDSFDEMTDLGSPEQVMAFAEQSFDAPLTWKAPRAGQPWEVGPESGMSSIHLEVTRGESAYYVTYTPKENTSGIEIGVSCPPPQIGVDAHVELSTEGGALAESFDTMLLAPSTELAMLSMPIDFDELSGSLAVTYSDPNVELVQVGLNVTLLAEGMTGSIAGIEQTNHGDAVSAGAAAIAVWPDSPACVEQYGDNSGIGVAPDQNALGITGDAAGELLAGTTPASVSWRDGTQTELTLTVAVEGDGCLKVSNNYGLDDGQNGMASYPARFTLHSEDARLDGEYLGRLFTRPSGDGNAVSGEAHLELMADQVAQSGFAMSEVPTGVERLAVTLTVSIEDGITQATVLLNGLTDPPCLTEPAEPMPQPGGGASAPGCEGTHITPIESTSWGD